MNSCSQLRTAVLAGIAVFLLANTARVSAQSVDPNTPTPVRTNTLVGKIAARDLGDARLTYHYYAFRGNPGDLLITVNSRNLNGDIDVFTANTLRPLLRLTVYAEGTAPVTKGIYLRRTEELVLRIEARSPNDDEGIYQLLFGGSFQAIEGGIEIAENEAPLAPTADTPVGGRRAKRASSVGARIDEPAPPVTEVAVATPTPEPTPEATPEASPVETTTPTVENKPTEVEAPRPTTRPTRNRRPTTRRTTPPATRPKVANTEETKTEEPKTEEPKTETSAEAPKPTTPTRPARRGATSRTTPPAPEPEAAPVPRLIIETNDGTLINRSMSEVRRVTVENGQVLVVGRDGKIDRIRLATVVKMSIEPQ